jgi:deoxyhypusine synthase
LNSSSSSSSKHFNSWYPYLQAVLVPGNTIPDTPIVKGYDFDTGRDLDGLMAAMIHSGFQATALGQAIEEVNRMVRCG